MMVQDGVSPTVWSYNVMMKGYVKARQGCEAWEFFLEIKRRGVEVLVVTYTMLVRGFGMAGEVARARNVFKRTVEEGVLPTVATYNALIQVLCRKDRVEEGMELFEEMIKKGYVPNSMEYLSEGILIHQSTYMEKVLARFRMDKTHPFTTPMMVYSLDVKKDAFRFKKDDDDLLDPERR
ncbi:Pentatricopeptide repeat-containing protein [Drosera capensis]